MTTAGVSGFADAYGQLSENQRGYVLAGVVNNAVQSQEYMDNYRSGGYMRDYDKPLEGTAAPWEIIDPRSLFRLATSLGRDAVAGGAAMLGAGREIMGSLLAKGESALARFTAGGTLRPGAASALEGGPAFINKIWASSMTLKTNAQLYGSAITRAVNEIPGLMQKAGYSAEELAGYRFVRLSEDGYAARVAERRTYGGGEFDATYGPNLINPNAQYRFDVNIASKLANGDSGVTIYLRPGVLESDEHIVQAVAHEMSEIEMASYEMKGWVSGKQFNQWTAPNVKNNWHYDAVIAGDKAVNAFRVSSGY